MINIIIKHRNDVRNIVQGQDKAFSTSNRTERILKIYKSWVLFGLQQARLSFCNDFEFSLNISYDHFYYKASQKTHNDIKQIFYWPAMATSILDTYPRKRNRNQRELQVVREEQVLRKDHIECHGLPWKTRSFIFWCPSLTIPRLSGKDIHEELSKTFNTENATLFIFESLSTAEYNCFSAWLHS